MLESLSGLKFSLSAKKYSGIKDRRSLLFSRLVKALADTTVSYQELGFSNAENM